MMACLRVNTRIHIQLHASLPEQHTPRFLDELDEIDGELDDELEAQIAAELDEGGGGLDDPEIDGELEGLELEGDESGSEVLVGGEGSDGSGSGVLINEKDVR